MRLLGEGVGSASIRGDERIVCEEFLSAHIAQHRQATLVQLNVIDVQASRVSIL